ncbi:hypothetical protein EVC45_03520 [Paraburkholderia sp. UYCP14C]|uniref:hypothetical protein n=1 Tax=Paraburkholderia sp. UYCP14C TaxID=2511130 RepID=UPI0010213306|nr:hypothetical protein [Paraburkholderia sp. UYCP14C]RZF31034.1 hypothetical protein EVC45_03520 [Paraburkholderia sp. UYCP14C]
MSEPEKRQTKPHIKITHAAVTLLIGFAVRDVAETDAIPRKKVAFSVHCENNVLFYRFASELTAFRSTRNKLWHNPRSFPRRATVSGSTRSNGTVPVNQNLIQGRRRSFTVPVATAASMNVPDSVVFFAAAAHSDHPIIETSQR